MEELKREVTVNGYGDSPDLAEIGVGRVDAGPELDRGRVEARCPAERLRGTPPAGESSLPVGAIRSGGFRLRGNESGTKVILVQSDRSVRGCLGTVVRGLLVCGPGRWPGRSGG